MNKTVLIRGAGDIASGIAVRLFNAKFRVIMLDIKNPSSIRRLVSFSEAIYDNECEVEGIKARKVSIEDIEKTLQNKQIPVLVDENLDILNHIKVDILVDAILAKKNLGTTIDMAPIVIGVGPGFYAKKDVHAVIETARGHDLGRVIYDGYALENTGIPGEIAGVSKDRVIYSPCKGKFHSENKISDIVQKGDIIGYVDKEPIKASISGVLRGLIRNGYYVKANFKIADIDPRINERKNCFSISDKARSVAGGVLEAIMHLRSE